MVVTDAEFGLVLPTLWKAENSSPAICLTFIQMASSTAPLIATTSEQEKWIPVPHPAGRSWPPQNCRNSGAILSLASKWLCQRTSSVYHPGSYARGGPKSWGRKPAEVAADQLPLFRCFPHSI